MLPHEMKFVVDVPESGTVTEHADFDLCQPDGAEGPLPAVIFVPGPITAQLPVRPRHWPMYQGYARLMAGRGVLGVVIDQPYHDVSQWPEMAESLVRIVESVRALDEVDADRIAVWAFSAGAMQIGRWLTDSPEWLRCLALTYPVLDIPYSIGPGRPVILTRVGRERPEWQATVDRFRAEAEAAGTAVRLIDVPDGQHGFDVLDPAEQSRRAVLEAADLVLRDLSPLTRFS
ncbi:alpha/beta hydrolase [Actinocrispum wychmicini]|uniref:Dienelactone hydrolase n=1 Tax=Actinocrispum wychmicini TaxID=1213861 RepID=A0A4R2JF97_9PSEU|nr:hypothetical protein [Actinocrispum wychmicini]TCO58411.1 dienelactone hydrolase [Actinocrispum wychmicini]